MRAHVRKLDGRRQAVLFPDDDMLLKRLQALESATGWQAESETGQGLRSLRALQFRGHGS